VKLHHYFRSSASYRVRIGLELKGLAWEAVPVHLLRDGGEQHLPENLRRNPQALVPFLEDGGRIVVQSLAILEYLDEIHPDPPQAWCDADQALTPGEFAQLMDRVEAVASAVGRRLSRRAHPQSTPVAA